MPQGDASSSRGRWTRRRFAGAGLTAGAAAAAMAWGGGALAAAGARRPAATRGQIRLTVSIAYQGAGTFTGTMQEIVNSYIAANFSAKHPGVEVTTIAGMGCNGSCLSSADEIAATLAGTGADIITGCCNDWYNYVSANMLLPLDPFARADNVNLGVFSPGHIAGLTTPRGLLALPEYDGPMVMSVNEGMLDDLGLAYPAPGWTYTDAARLFHAVAGNRGGKRIYGATLYTWQAGNTDWWAAAWGGETGSPGGTRCLLSSPKAMAAYEWFTQLYRENVIFATSEPWTGTGGIYSGLCAFNMSGGWNVQSDMQSMRGMKWDYYPMPRFPAGQRTYVNNDFYAINAYSKNPHDVIWQMLKFLTMDRGFAQLQYKTTFITPNQTALWPEWIDIVRQVAPPLRDKNLEAYMGATRYDTAQYFFKYDNNGAANIFNNYVGKMVAGQTDARLGLEEVTGRINALEASGAKLSAVSAATARQAGAEIAAAEHGTRRTFTAPERLGVGTAPVPAGQLVTVGSGAFTLTGVGAGLVGATADGTFACAPATAARAAYTVRLTQFSNIDESPMSPGAKAGLLLRQDLSDDAPSFALVISGQEGEITAAQGFAEAQASHQRMANGSALLKTLSAARGKNFLKRPIWLRIVRDVTTFHALTSSDGRTWHPAGTRVSLPVASGWIGLFVTAHDSGKQVRAQFDHVTGFSPDDFVVLGGGQ